MSLKEFWKLNKYDYIFSCLAFTFAVLILGTIKKYDSATMILSILFSYPAIFLMGFGISSIYKN